MWSRTTRFSRCKRKPWNPIQPQTSTRLQPVVRGGWTWGAVSTSERTLPSGATFGLYQLRPEGQVDAMRPSVSRRCRPTPLFPYRQRPLTQRPPRYDGSSGILMGSSDLPQQGPTNDSWEGMRGAGRCSWKPNNPPGKPGGIRGSFFELRMPNPDGPSEA